MERFDRLATKIGLRVLAAFLIYILLLTIYMWGHDVSSRSSIRHAVMPVINQITTKTLNLFVIKF